MAGAYALAGLGAGDRAPVIDIFNYYIEHSFAAYLETRVPYEFYDRLLALMQGYPAYALKGAGGEVAGFGFLRPYSSMPAFSRTAEIAYFIRDGYTGRGLGEILLSALEREARQLDIDCILASISSLNEPSLKFHAKHGFKECGRFARVGRKRGTDFDVVWMQKHL